MKVIDVHAHVFPDAVAQKAVDNLRTYYSYTMHGNGRFDDLKASATRRELKNLSFIPPQQNRIRLRTLTISPRRLSAKR